MRADWTACGACTSGWTAPRADATRRARGGAVMTSTTRPEAGEMDPVGATCGREIARRMAREPASQRAFLGVCTLLFAGSAAATVAWCGSMAAMEEIPMPGG